MPVIPAFGSFASTPNTAQAYLGGARIAVEQQQLAASVAQHSAQLQLEQQRLQQQAQMAEMELAAKQAAQQREELVRQQQNQIENQYKQQMIGLKQREIEQSHQKLVESATAAARQFAASQNYEQAISSKAMTPQEALFKYGPDMAAGAGFFSAAGQASRGATDLGGATHVAGLPDNYMQAMTGPNSRQIIAIPNSAGTSPGTETAKIRALSAEANALSKSLASPDPFLLKTHPELIEADRKRLDTIRAALDKSTGLGGATIPAGITNTPSTNRIGRFNVISNADVSR